MRTKALLCAAALAAGAASSMAAGVYSLNVVGYINLSLTNGYNLIANQLDLDGTMTNNTLYTVFSTNLPNKSSVYAWSTSLGGFNKSSFAASSGNWGGDATDVNLSLQPGGGVFVQIPASTTTPYTVTLVGQVIQGTNSVPLVGGLNMVSYIAPISGGIGSVLGYTPTKKDFFVPWDPINQVYGTKLSYSGTTWTGGVEPTPAVAQAFFLNTTVATNWVMAFTVQ